MAELSPIASTPDLGPTAPLPEMTPPSRVFRRLLGMLRPYWGQIALGLALLLAAAPAELFAPLVWQWVVDVPILKHPDAAWAWMSRLFSFNGRIADSYSLLLSALGWMFAVYLIGETFETLHEFILGRVAQRFILGFRNDVYHKLQSQSLAYLQRQRTGDLMSRAMGDVDELQNFIVTGIDMIVGEGVRWLLTVALVLSLDWRVGGASLAPLIIVYLLLKVFNRWIGPIYKTVRERAGDVSTRLQENLSGVIVIKIFGREQQEAQRFRQATEGYYVQQIRALKARSLFFPFSRVVGFFSNVFMLGLGGYYLLVDGSFTLGKMLAFRGYWWRMFGPIQILARVNDMIQRAVAAGRRLFEVLDAPDELPDAADAMALEEVRGEMELRNVSFAYGREGSGFRVQGSGAEDKATRRGGDKANIEHRTLNTEHGSSSLNPEPRTPNPQVLHEISIRIEPGQTVALCGPSGSGKSTILSLLLRFYDPVAGEVLIDGRDIRSIQRDSLRRHFGLVQQETFLFNDSILDNIRYGHREATMEQVIAAAKAANAHHFITQLPNGYETNVGERGVRLSGGQKQRLSIARAFLANPSVLLLDEPTSSVEPDSEAAIIAALDRLMAGRTTVLTSHRPSLINQAEWVYVVENGRITEQGRPEELRANGGWFERFIRTAEGDIEVDETRADVGG